MPKAGGLTFGKEPSKAGQMTGVKSEAKDMESRNTKRSIQSKRKHTEKLCLVLRVVPQKKRINAKR